MAAWPIVRIAGTISLLSSAVLLTLIVIGIASGGGGPVPLDFGDPIVLERLAASGSTGHLIEVLALIAPVLGMAAGIGWLYLAGKDRGEVRMGVLVWYIGMIFIVGQDALEVAAFETLPAAYLASGEATAESILVLGDLTGNVIHILTLLGDTLSGAGMVLVALALLARADRLRLFGWIGIASVVAALGGLAIPGLSLLRLPGFLLMLVWNVGLALAMLREDIPATPQPARA